MSVVLMIVVVLVAVAIGYFIGRLGRGDIQRIKLEYEQQLQVAEQELVSYRQQVTEHFKGTSQLVEQMNENYRAVYMHLAEGAQHLTDEKVILETVSSPLIAEKEAVTLPADTDAGNEAETVVNSDEQESKAPLPIDEPDSAESARKAGL